MSAKPTKTKREPSAASLREMPEVRDWSHARRGYWAGKLRSGNTRNLEPEIAAAFPDDEAVNAALRVVLEVAKVVTKRRRRHAA